MHKQFENYANQPCDRQTKDEKSTRYMVCSVERVTGKPRVISASSSLIETGDGIGYWFTEESKVAAIRFFHSGELFMFDIDGKLKVELISAQKVMVNGEEQFQKRSVRTKFDQATRDRLEKLAKGGGEDILSKFKPKSKQIAPKTDGTANLCTKAIRQGTIRLETIPNVTVTRNSRFAPLSTIYPDAKSGLNRRYTFTLSRGGFGDACKATEMRLEIARQVINSCAGVAEATFARDHTGEAGTIGLFPNGSIKQFSCATDFDLRTRTRPPLTWGQQACNL